MASSVIKWCVGCGLFGDKTSSTQTLQLFEYFDVYLRIRFFLFFKSSRNHYESPKHPHRIWDNYPPWWPCPASFCSECTQRHATHVSPSVWTINIAASSCELTPKPALASSWSSNPTQRMELFLLLSLVATLVCAAPERQRHIRRVPLSLDSKSSMFDFDIAGRPLGMRMFASFQSRHIAEQKQGENLKK